MHGFILMDLANQAGNRIKWKIQGYRANMITWRYRILMDGKKINSKEGPYAVDHSGF